MGNGEALLLIIGVCATAAEWVLKMSTMYFIIQAVHKYLGS